MTTIAPRNKKPGVKPESPCITISVAAEAWRFRAYIAFWGMCAFAIVLAKVLVTPILAAGPPDGSVCGPFNRNSPEFGVLPGEGFDFVTKSHLVQLFGFANICANWDYSPSRELTAMAYPLFEYSLIIYLCLDFCATYIAYKRGELTEAFWMFARISFPVCLVLCSQFRMIFVIVAYENVSGHTAGFLGLQVALILVAIQNTAYIFDAEIHYDVVGGLKNTRMIAAAYIICDLIICAFKITATTYVVQNGAGAPWTLEPSPLPGKCMGQFVDMIWMIFNAVVPLLVSRFRAQNEAPLEITISQKAIYLDGTGSAEVQPLTGGGSHPKYENKVYESVASLP